MSVKVMGLVWDHYPEGGGELLTALKLADHADHIGDRIWPGVASLARQTRQSERTVQRHLQAMLDSGWLVRVEAGGKGPAHTTRYRMPIEAIPQGAVGRVTKLHPSSSIARVTPGTAKGDIHDKKGDTAMSPEPSLKQSPRAGRGTRLPPDWKPTPDLQAWARTTRPDLNHPEVLAQFVDHWIATPGSRGTKLDWPATYRNWVRGEKRINGAARPTGTGEPPTITCSVCHQKARIWTAGKCDPCWRASQGLEARP